MGKGPKWIGLKGKYDKPPVDAGYREKQDLYLDTPMVEGDEASTPRLLDDLGVAELYNTAKLGKAAAESVAKAYELKKDALARLMADRFEEDGKYSTSFTNGGSMRITPDVYVSVKDNEGMLKWVRDNGMEAMLSLNFQTMQSMVKERLTKGLPIPEWADIYLKDKLTLSGFGKSDGETEQND